MKRREASAASLWRKKMKILPLFMWVPSFCVCKASVGVGGGGSAVMVSLCTSSCSFYVSFPHRDLFLFSRGSAVNVFMSFLSSAKVEMWSLWRLDFCCIFFFFAWGGIKPVSVLLHGNLPQLEQWGVDVLSVVVNWWLLFLLCWKISGWFYSECTGELSSRCGAEIFHVFF